MKKLLFVALIGTFVACGEATESTETAAPAEDTTTVVAPDTTAPAAADTTVSADTTAPAAQ